MSETGEYDLKVKQQDDNSWLVLDRDGSPLAGPFLYPIDAANWARVELIRRKTSDG